MFLRNAVLVNKDLLVRMAEVKAKKSERQGKGGYMGR